MFKTVADEIWVFDCEWVPDPASGRRAYELPADLPDADVVLEMFRQGGATEEDPRPFLKTALCRVVSISTLERRVTGSHPVSLELRSLPAAGEGPLAESALISRFLDAVGKAKPQLVGFNLRNADIPILVQRAMALGLSARGFCERPTRPWDGMDYFSNTGDAVVDLAEVFGIRGRGSPSLHELACAAGIPGKLDESGAMVVDLWQAGDMDRIVGYNECDTLTTYLIWLRAARLAGFVSAAEFQSEERHLEALLHARIARGAQHLQRFLDRWTDWRSSS